MDFNEEINVRSKLFYEISQEDFVEEVNSDQIISKKKKEKEIMYKNSKIFPAATR